MGPCIMGKRRQLLYILELARLQVFAEALSQRGTLASLLELHDDELMRLAQETGKSWAPNATIYWIKKTQKLRRQAQQFLDHFRRIIGKQQKGSRISKGEAHHWLQCSRGDRQARRRSSDFHSKPHSLFLQPHQPLN